jgi:hypothetical protein
MKVRKYLFLSNNSGTTKYIKAYARNMCGMRYRNASIHVMENLVTSDVFTRRGVKEYRKLSKAHQQNQKRKCRRKRYFFENIKG